MSLKLDNSDKKIRLDRWLKLSCLFKTRALATRACEEGKVKVNHKRAKPAQMIHIGDVITVKMKNKYRTFEVLEIVQKNVSKKEARTLYHEQKSEVSEESKGLSELLRLWHEEGKRKYKGRPTKKERRQIDKLKGRE